MNGTLIDFLDHSQGSYTNKGKIAITPSNLSSLQDTQIITTDPDLEYYSMIIPRRQGKQYSMEFTVDQIKAEKLSVDFMKVKKHFILIADRFEVAVRFSKIKDDCFELICRSYIHIYAKKFRLGDPFDELQYGE